MRVASIRAPLIVAVAYAMLIVSTMFVASIGSRGSAVAADQPPPTQAASSPQALEELLSPIALYPDVLLTQILAASVDSQEVLDGGNWLLQNQNLQGNELDSAAEKAGFGPAMRALFQVPTVVDMMCQEIDWTRQVGAAFTADQKAVLDAVQRLRGQAKQAGNLKSTSQQTVTTTTENNQVIVEIKPADPTVIYVPQYDPQVVYTTPPPAQENGVSAGAAVATGLIAFTAGVIVGNAFDNDDYCYPRWGYGAVYVGPRPFYPPAYAYRPVYGPAFHPAYSYRPPANYRHSYNRVDVDNNINVNINNSRNDYFNRFDNNQNVRAGARNTDINARNTAVNARNADVNAPNTERASQAANRQPSQTPHRDQAQAPRGDRGYGGAASAAAPAERPAPRTNTAHENAFEGARSAENASFDRAASARGRASTAPSRQRVAAQGGGRRRG